MISLKAFVEARVKLGMTHQLLLAAVNEGAEVTLVCEVTMSVQVVHVHRQYLR